MSFADILVACIVVALVAYAIGTGLVWRRTHSPATLLVLLLAPYWTIVGAIPVLVQKRTSGGREYSYLERKLFPLYPDTTYAVVLIAYVVFLLGSLAVIGLVSRDTSDRSAQLAGDDAWSRVAASFSHVFLLVGLVAGTVAKLGVVALLVRSAGTTSLYEATRIVRGDNAALIRIYQYLSVAVSYPLAAGFTMWLSIPSARRSRGRREQLAVWSVYLGLLLAVLAENALLGNRATLLVMMGAIGAGWFRWRFLPAGRAERVGLRRRFALACTAGLLALGTIGISRGGRLTSPGAVVQNLWVNVLGIANVVVQEFRSSEKLAAHMSLYGVIRDAHTVHPFTGDAYGVYVATFNAPREQVFTIHYVAAWWLQIGALGVVAAIVTFALAVGGMQRLATRPPTLRSAATRLAASTIPAAGIPIVLLRSGPEALRAVVVEFLVIPTLVLWPCFMWRRWTGRDRRADA